MTYTDAIGQARIAAEAALMAAQEAQALPEDAPWWQFAASTATALQYAWELTDPRYGQWRRDIAAELLARGVPQLTVATLSGVSSSSLKKWIAAAPEEHEGGAYRSEEVPAARRKAARHYLGILIGSLVQALTVIHEAMADAERGPEPPIFTMGMILTDTARTPALERIVSSAVGMLHAGGMSAKSLGSYMGLSDVSVRSRGMWMGEYYTKALSETD